VGGKNSHRVHILADPAGEIISNKFVGGFEFRQGHDEMKEPALMSGI
jgi:hypothetical protein